MYAIGARWQCAIFWRAGLGRIPNGLEVSDEHFLLGLQARENLAIGVGVVRVGGKVVVNSDGGQARAERQPLGLSEFVFVLPVEIVGGHVQQRLRSAIGIARLVAEGFAAVMHVRLQREQESGAVKPIHPHGIFNANRDGDTRGALKSYRRAIYASATTLALPSEFQLLSFFCSPLRFHSRRLPSWPSKKVRSLRLLPSSYHVV